MRYSAGQQCLKNSVTTGIAVCDLLKIKPALLKIVHSRLAGAAMQIVLGEVGSYQSRLCVNPASSNAQMNADNLCRTAGKLNGNGRRQLLTVILSMSQNNQVGIVFLKTIWYSIQAVISAASTNFLINKRALLQQHYDKVDLRQRATTWQLASL